MEIGVFALQGAFIEHEVMLEKLGVNVREIRQKKDLDGHLDGVIIPGGESTVMGKLLVDLDLADPLKKKIGDGLPAFGTCAGLIMLSKEVDGKPGLLATMNISAKRNAYGRQSGSFNATEVFANKRSVPMTFIRAPYIESVDPSVEILARVDGKIVAARENNILVTAFHPELDEDTFVHEYFLDIVKSHIERQKK